MHLNKPKKAFLAQGGGGGGGGEYVSNSSNAYSDLYDINSKQFYCSQDQIDGFVMNLKKMVIAIKKEWLFLILLLS